MKKLVTVSIEPVESPPQEAVRECMRAYLTDQGYEAIVSDVLQPREEFSSPEELLEHAVKGLERQLDASVSFSGYVLLTNPVFVLEESGVSLSVPILFCCAKMRGVEVFSIQFVGLCPHELRAFLTRLMGDAVLERLQSLRQTSPAAQIDAEMHRQLSLFLDHLKEGAALSLGIAREHSTLQ